MVKDVDSTVSSIFCCSGITVTIFYIVIILFTIVNDAKTSSKIIKLKTNPAYNHKLKKNPKK
jgi:hypothetical protein